DGAVAAAGDVVALLRLGAELGDEADRGCADVGAADGRDATVSVLDRERPGDVPGLDREGGHVGGLAHAAGDHDEAAVVDGGDGAAEIVLQVEREVVRAGRQTVDDP